MVDVVWIEERCDARQGTYWTAGNFRVLEFDDTRKRWLVYKMSERGWVQICNRRQAAGIIKARRGGGAEAWHGSMAPDWNDPRDLRGMTLITRGSKSKPWTWSKPSNTKRTSNGGVAAARGQGGNRQGEGSS